MTRILVLCTGNSCRSQMAEGFLRSFAPGVEVFSAGTRPAERVHPLAIHVMGEVGIDLRNACPKHVAQYITEPFDYVLTVCDSAKETCPVFVGHVGRRLHVGFEDPADATGTEEQVLGVFRRVRDEIRNRMFAFHQEMTEHKTDRRGS